MEVEPAPIAVAQVCNPEFLSNRWWTRLASEICDVGTDGKDRRLSHDMMSYIMVEKWWIPRANLQKFINKELHFSIPKSVREKRGSSLTQTERLANFLAEKYNYPGAYMAEE